MTGIARARGEQAVLAEIAARATSLDQRIALATGAPSAPGGPAPLPDPTTAAMLEVWARNIGRGFPELFQRRLGWDGLDPCRLAVTVRAPPPDPDRLPSWVEVLEHAYAWGRQAAHGNGGQAPGPWVQRPARAVDAEEPLPFEELLLPLVEHARRQVAGRTSVEALAGGAAATLERALLKQLTRICAQAFFVTFSVFCSARGSPPENPADAGAAPERIRYAEFLASMRAGGLLTFFQEYCVAARLCATTTRNWIGFVVEFLERLAQDRPALERLFGDGAPAGPVVSVEVGVSDAHEGGRGVIICRFASGTRVVYKPRPVALEEFFAELVRFSNGTGLVLPLRPAAVLSRQTHGWVEWIGAAPCTDQAQVQRFHRRCGMLLAMLHAVHGADFHSGNLLASGEHPVLIDAEALLTPRFELESAGRPSVPPIVQLFEAAGADAVTRIYLLPWLKFTADGQAMDLGGLTVTAPADQTMEVLVWRDINTDAMRLGPARLPAAISGNLPLLDGQYVLASAHVEEVVAGFRQMYDLLVAHRGDLLGPGGLLARLGPQPVRFVFRHTSLYQSLLDRALHPKFLRDGAVRSMELDVLARTLLQLPERPVVWPLLTVERDALEQQDVPLFSTRADGRSIALATGSSVECFQSSAVAEARRKLLGLGESDRRVQEDLIRASFAAALARGLTASPPATRPGPTAAPSDHAPFRQWRQRVREEAVRLGQVLAARAHLHAGLPVWAAPSYAAPARRHNAAAGGPVLLDGNAGIALALAAVATIIPGGGGLAALARDSLAPLCGPLGPVADRLLRGTWDAGIGTGVASCAYGLLRAARLLDDSRLLAAALDWAALLDPAALSQKGPDDLVSGRAGALLLLLRLHAETGDADVLARALRFADDLLARRISDPRTRLAVWPGPRGHAETGLAHGQSGIAYALNEAAASTGRADLRAAALEAISHERRVLGAALAGAQPDEAHSPWSHGSTGIGLARAGMLARFEDPDVRRDLKAAVDQTRQHLHAGTDDLCSGAFGRIELLCAAADVLHRPRLRIAARRGVVAVLDRRAREGQYRLGWHAGYQHPGLFQGLAGIAWSLVRQVDPRRVPMLTLWA